MTQVLPEELSALIDGELDPGRAAEVRRRIEADPDLQAAFDALRVRDERWRTAARTAAFAPEVLPVRTRRSGRWLAGLAVAAALVGLRLAVRAIDAAAVAFALQALVLFAVLCAVASAARPERRPRNA